MMRGAVRLFNVFNISINIHITFLLLPLIFGFYYGLKGIVLILLVFLFVTMHELTHSLQARRYGIKVKDITLLPIGGVASMSAIPEKPRQEFFIAIAGPLFNITLALILFTPLYYFLGPKILFNPGIESWPKVIAYIFWINPVLALFNLLPAFPMDGGRVLRSFLADRMDYHRATEIAVGIGHAFAILFGFFGIISKNFILVVIAVFIYIAASQEELQVSIRTILKRFFVRDVLQDEFFTVEADSTLSDVLNLIFHSHQENFPVIENNKLVGVLTRTKIIHNIHQFGMGKKVREVMIENFPVLRPGDRLAKAQQIMEKNNLLAVPVVEKEKLYGIITLEDISRVYSMVSARH